MFELVAGGRGGDTDGETGDGAGAVLVQEFVTVPGGKLNGIAGELI